MCSPNSTSSPSRAHSQSTLPSLPADTCSHETESWTLQCGQKGWKDGSPYPSKVCLENKTYVVFDIFSSPHLTMECGGGQGSRMCWNHVINQLRTLRWLINSGPWLMREDRVTSSTSTGLWSKQELSFYYVRPLRFWIVCYSSWPTLTGATVLPILWKRKLSPREVYKSMIELNLGCDACGAVRLEC